MSMLGLCEPGEASARFEWAATATFCSLITTNSICAQSLHVLFPCPLSTCGSSRWNLQPVKLRKKHVPALSVVSRKICWMWGKYVVHGRKAELEKFSSTFWKNAWGISTEYSELTWSIYGLAEIRLLERKPLLKGLAALPVFSWDNKSHNWGMFKRAMLAQFGFQWGHGIAVCGVCFIF